VGAPTARAISGRRNCRHRNQRLVVASVPDSTACLALLWVGAGAPAEMDVWCMVETPAGVRRRTLPL
jgi:hypothetical protein